MLAGKAYLQPSELQALYWEHISPTKSCIQKHLVEAVFKELSQSSRQYLQYTYILQKIFNERKNWLCILS